MNSSITGNLLFTQGDHKNRHTVREKHDASYLV
uniref:Uncharacterized protein n=1 Tax=Anguilla anguilla TaxID=7936 RepID=A0A0E9QZN0_ANGAN